MAAKLLLVCASALFVQSAMSQCLGRIGAGLGPYTTGWGYDGLALDGLGCNGLGYDGLGYNGLGYNGLGYNDLGYNGLGYNGLGYDGLAYGAGWPAGRVGCGAIAPAAELVASYGGGLPVSTASPMAPTGLAVASENVYEGPVAVAGNLPFLGTVAVEGVFPTAGAGAVSYGCGDGAVAITAEGPIGAYGAYGNAAIAPAALAPGLAAPLGLGYRGLAGRGCGCGAIY